MSNITGAERRQAASDLAKKLRLEAIFAPKIQKLFKRMVRAYRAGVVKTGRSISAEDFKETWQKLIFEHQRSVQRVFKKPQKQVEGDSEDLLLLALLAWAERNSLSDAEEITATNQKNMDVALTQARDLITEQGLSTDNATLAATAAVLLDRKFQGRVEGIKSFETQGAAESTKLTVAEIESGVEPSVLSGTVAVIGVTTTKKWVTVGDNKVRLRPFNHRAANGQVKNLIEPFEVSGELLRHPGDKSLGASIGNTIN